ncbi:hypothetical protein ATANTOWER_005939 [Ataeniobius toweri]|uniref:Uncharacterized protein n=1 Tax=Ataeniobius toweri TaxID=208326 RepID=A0ABU7A591_9TELE|nr:hypothetical protein [Ataeniobius toweri]
MSEKMKVEAEDPGGLRLVPSIPAASPSELEQTQDGKDRIHQMLALKEEVPHNWSSNLDQQDSEHPHIKEEEEELWISQEEEQRNVKSEDEEKPQLSELHQIKTEDNSEIDAPTRHSAEQLETNLDGLDCEGPEPNCNQDPGCSYQKTLLMFEASLCLVNSTPIGSASKVLFILFYSFVFFMCMKFYLKLFCGSISFY